VYVYTHVLLFHLADMIPELASLVPDAASLLNNKDDPLFMFVEMGDVGWVVFLRPHTLCFTRAQGVPLYNAGLKAVYEVGGGVSGSGWNVVAVGLHVAAVAD
jgi:hypothetical protein